VAVKPKELRFAVDLRESGSLRTEDGTALEADPAWSPEHLLLAAVVRCSLKSLRHHATRAAIEVASARGSARTLITKRETDGRYATVETEVELEVELDPQPGDDELAELLAKAERDCFIGASLTAHPTYRWTVGGIAQH
jgi:organic hydroperoxide reductase OsmC/OhrA